jgi:zinc protease
LRSPPDYRQALVEALYNQMLSQRLFELTQTAEPPYLGAFSGQGRIVRSKEVYMLAALVQEGGLITGLEALLTEAERVARYGFAASELDRAKTELLRGLEQAYDERENTDSRMHVAEYLRHFLEGEPFPGIEYEFALTGELLPTIGLAEVNRLASEWITEGNRAVLVNAPEKEGLQTPNEAALTAVFLDVAARPIEPYEDAVADVPLVADMPAAGRVVRQESVEEVGLTIWELANGARVLLKPTDFKDDEILFDAWSPGGTSLAADESYVAATTAAGVVRTSGAGAFTLVELDKALAGRAASVRPYVSSLYEAGQHVVRLLPDPYQGQPREPQRESGDRVLGYRGRGAQPASLPAAAPHGRAVRRDGSGRVAGVLPRPLRRCRRLHLRLRGSLRS